MTKHLCVIISRYAFKQVAQLWWKCKSLQHRAAAPSQTE